MTDERFEVYERASMKAIRGEGLTEDEKMSIKEHLDWIDSIWEGMGEKIAVPDTFKKDE